MIPWRPTLARPPTSQQRSIKWTLPNSCVRFSANQAPGKLLPRTCESRTPHHQHRCATLKLMTQATYDDANLLLHLYELRRETRMRTARAWFVSSFKPKTLAELQELCPPASDNNAQMRMVTSYWEMAASFVAAGVLNPELFFVNNRELLVVWLRVQHVVAELRTTFKDPGFLKNLETVGKQYADYLNHTSPGTFDAFAARMGG